MIARCKSLWAPCLVLVALSSVELVKTQRSSLDRARTISENLHLLPEDTEEAVETIPLEYDSVNLGNAFRAVHDGLLSAKDRHQIRKCKSFLFSYVMYDARQPH